MLAAAAATARAAPRQPRPRPFAVQSSASRHRPADSSVAARASKGFGGFDIQFGWPYVLILVEFGCVAAHARTPLAITSIFLVLFQSPQDNALLKLVASSGIFARYKDAKFFCQALTFATFFNFLLVSYLMAR